MHPGPWDREEALERLTDERFAARGIRGPQPSAKEQDEAFLAEFDRMAQEKNLYARDDLGLPPEVAQRVEEQRKARFRARGWRV